MSSSHTASVRNQFNKHGRAKSFGPGKQGGLTNGEGANGDANEHTSLLQSTGASLGNLAHIPTNDGSDRTPLYKDPRWWVRIPANTLYLTWRTLASNYVNVFLVFVPIGIVLGALNIDPTAIFIVNFLAIIPLASLLSFATEELSVKLGETIGGLLNATFGNAVELIVSGQALLKCGELLLTHAAGLHRSPQKR